MSDGIGPHAYYLDLSGRFPWPGREPAYGRGFRIGDRAVAHVLALHWRHSHPGCRLRVFEDTSWPECQPARELDATWLVGSIADDIVDLSSETEVARPGGLNIYSEPLWDFWKRLHENRPAWLQPTICPYENAQARASEFLLATKVSTPFIVLQPLVDANYNSHRNRSWNWWLELASVLSKAYDVVIAASATYSEQPRLRSPRVHYTFDGGLSPMDVLALLASSALFIGGETGLTLWAPILSVPTYAAFARQSINPYYSTAPLSFGQPVLVKPLEITPAEHAHCILKFFELKR